MSSMDTKPTFKVNHNESADSDSEYDSDAEEIKDPWCDPENPRILGFQDITAASFRIRSGIIRTPCDVSGDFVLVLYRVPSWCFIALTPVPAILSHLNTFT